jgi:hypothetical protein
MTTRESSTPAAAALGELRSQITELVANNAVAMVQNAIDAVNEEGQYQAIKFLFEMIGLYPAVADDQSEVEDSLAKVLLQHLGIDPQADWGPEPEAGGQSGDNDPLQ